MILIGPFKMLSENSLPLGNEDNDELFAANLTLHLEDITKYSIEISTGTVDISNACTCILRKIEYFKDNAAFLATNLDKFVPIVADTILKTAKKIEKYSDSLEVLYELASIIFSTCRIVGHKTVSGFLSQNAHGRDATLSIFVNLLKQERSFNTNSWKLDYLIFMWSSLLFQIPFSIKSKSQESLTSSLGLSLLEAAWNKLNSVTEDRKMAGLFIFRYYSKVKETSSLLSLLSLRLQSEINLGYLEILSLLLSSNIIISEEEGHVIGKTLLSLIQLKGGTNTLVRKYQFKCLAFLCRRFYVQEYFEAIFVGIRDRESLIRECTTKYISLIIAILPSTFQEKLVEQIISRFNVISTDFSVAISYELHGLLLLLGNLLLNIHIKPNLIEKLDICQFLRINRIINGISSGTFLKDAACFVCWAIVRRFPVCDLSQSWALAMAQEVVCSAILDFDASVRRAAAAVFQELYGRWSKLFSLIDPSSLQVINFYTVCGVHHSYEKTAIAFCDKNPSFISHFINRLINCCISNVKEGFRMIASSLLANLADLSVKFRYDDQWNLVIEALISGCKDDDDLAKQHGSLVALSIMAGSDFCNSKSLSCLLPLSILIAGAEWTPKRLGWELMAKAQCMLIKSLGSKVDVVTFNEYISSWLQICKTSLESRDSTLQDIAATQTLSALSSRFAIDCPIGKSFFMGTVITAAEKDRNINAQRGFSLAIGSCPRWLHEQNFDFINQRLSKMIKAQNLAIEKRVNSLRSLATLLSQICHKPEYQPLPELDTAIKTLLWSLDDYTVDSRGDVGSHLRSAAINGLFNLRSSISPESTKIFVGKMVKHLFDKLDRLRALVVPYLGEFLCWNDETIIFLSSSVYKASEFYRKFRDSDLIPFDYFDYYVEGLVSSAGSVNELSAGEAYHLLQNVISRTNRSIFLKEYLSKLLSSNADGRRTAINVFYQACKDELNEWVEVVSPHVTRLIEILSDPSINMHDLMKAAKILRRVIPMNREAEEWWLSEGMNHQFPRIKEIFVDYYNTGVVEL